VSANYKNSKRDGAPSLLLNFRRSADVFLDPPVTRRITPEARDSLKKVHAD
jgi:hypothetical protein